MYGSIFGFQRLTRWPKWTPASMSSLKVTIGGTKDLPLLKTPVLDTPSPHHRRRTSLATRMSREVLRGEAPNGGDFPQPGKHAIIHERGRHVKRSNRAGTA